MLELRSVALRLCPVWTKLFSSVDRRPCGAARQKGRLVMNKKLIVLLSVALAAVLAVCACAGCKKKAPEVPADQVTVTMSYVAGTDALAPTVSVDVNVPKYATVMMRWWQPGRWTPKTPSGANTSTASMASWIARTPVGYTPRTAMR